MIISACAVNSVAVTPSDSTDISCAALYVGGAGNIAIKHKGSTATITYIAVPVGSIIPVRLINGRVMAATTATNIVAMSD